MYTDIDIFKKKTSTFLFKNDKEGQKEDLNSGKLWRRVRRLWAHQTGAGEPKASGGVEAALGAPRPYLITH